MNSFIVPVVNPSNYLICAWFLCFPNPSATVSFITTIDTSHKTMTYNYLNKSRKLTDTWTRSHPSTTTSTGAAVHSLLPSRKTILLQIVVDCNRGPLSQNTGFGDIKNSGSVSLNIIYLFLPFGSCVLIFNALLLLCSTKEFDLIIRKYEYTFCRQTYHFLLIKRMMFTFEIDINSLAVSCRLNHRTYHCTP